MAPRQSLRTGLKVLANRCGGRICKSSEVHLIFSGQVLTKFVPCHFHLFYGQSFFFAVSASRHAVIRMFLRVVIVHMIALHGRDSSLRI